MAAKKKTPAVAVDALGGATTVTFRDSKFEVPPFDEWGFLFMDAMSRGEENFPQALRCALGDDQYEALVGLRPKLSEVLGLVNQITSAMGVEPGES